MTRDELVESCIGLAYHIASKFSNLDSAEAESAALFGLLKAADSFDETIGIKFATYATGCMQNELYMSLRKSKKQFLDVSMELPVAQDKDGGSINIADVIPYIEKDFDRLEDAENHKAVLELLDRLGDRDATVMKMLYGIGQPKKTQAEVSKLLNISQSYVSRLEKMLLVKLRRLANAAHIER